MTPMTFIAHLPPRRATALTVLPFLAGERSPGWDDSARATIHGARLNTQPADLLLAGMEAVTYRLAAIYDLLVPVIGDPHVVHVSGGALPALRPLDAEDPCRRPRASRHSLRRRRTHQPRRGHLGA